MTSFNSEKDNDLVSETSHLKTILKLVPFLWPKERNDLKLRVILAVGALIGAKVAIIFVPILLGNIVDSLNKQISIISAVPIGMIAGYGCARLVSQALGEIRDALFERVQQNAIRNVALGVFRHLHSLSLRFHLERRTGGLSRVIERGAKAIEFVLRFSLFNIFPTLLEIFLVTLILIERYSVTIAIVTFISVVLYVTYTMVVTEWRIKFRREMNRSDNEAMSKAIDSLLNYETVKYFRNEEFEANRFNSSLKLYERASIRSTESLAVLNIGQATIMSLGGVVVLYIGASGVVGGNLTTGDFVAITAFMTQLFLPLNFLGFVYRQIKQSLVDMEKMFELLKIEPEVSDSPQAIPINMKNGEIIFHKVSFKYDVRRSMIKDLSFRASPGRTVAIVGPSGAGKSTISRLLYRFYDVDAGSIRIDGQDIRDVTQGSLRDEIGLVPQDVVLFNDTIGYNIRYGRPEATDEEVFKAATLARINGFIEGLPDGYETIVGERGLMISGGEKQRVAIARTILKNPSIFLFDESTSALDTKTEQEIQKSLLEISQSRTTIVIAHRLSTVVNADEIIVLDQGKVIERGTHEKLLESKGFYTEMWNRQQEADLEEGIEKASI